MKYDEKQLEKFAAERRACARLVGCAGAGRHQGAAARRLACLQEPATPQLPPPPPPLPPSSHQPLHTLLPVNAGSVTIQVPIRHAVRHVGRCAAGSSPSAR